MKIEITVSRNELFHKLKAVSKIINPSNKINPAWDNFLFEIGSELKVTAACEVGNITVKIDCEFQVSEKEISFMADAKTMLDGLKELSEQPLKLCFNADSYSFEIYHEYGRFKVHTSEAKFPTIKINSDGSKSFSIDAHKLIAGISSTIKFASNDELRPALTTIYAGIIAGSVTFCGSDAHALSTIKFPFECDFEANLTIPIRMAKLLINLVDSENVSIEFTDKHIASYFGDYEVCFRGVDKDYPNFRSVIPKINDKHLVVDTRLLISSISRVSVFSNKSNNLIQLSAGENTLKLSGKNYDFDQLAEETIPAEFDHDECFEIGFNAAILLTCLDEIQSDNVLLTFSEPQRQALIFPKDGDVEQTILIMPLMINT